MRDIQNEIRQNEINRISKILWTIYDNCKEDNSDLYKESRINKNVINNVIIFLNRLSTTLLEKITSNEIYSTPYGTIIIKFIKNNIEYEISTNECNAINQ